MDLNFSKEDLAFRDEVRGFIAEAFDDELQAAMKNTRAGYLPKHLHVRWQKKLHEKGWLAPNWPVEHGGAGFTPGQKYMFEAEMAVAGCPMTIPFGPRMVAPVIMKFGSEEQKKRFLPDILATNKLWCQGYSEPGSGSDLASLKTTAVREGDEYVINGHKIWTSYAHYADWMFCLVRTDPNVKKQAGITFLLIDMTSPGITTRPIELISGSSPFCEVFFDSVRVPAHQVVGKVNDGWRVAKALLRHERGMVGESVAAGGARVDVLKPYTVRDHAREVIGLDSSGKLADPLLRDAVAASEMEQELMRLTVRRANDAMKAGSQPGAESSILKVVGTELNQRRWELAMRIAGSDGLGWAGETYSDRDLALARQWLRSRGNTIEGGSSEVQRNILARTVLRMPK